MIFYAGDIHGNVFAAKSIDDKARKAGVDIAVQVGDFGLGFQGAGSKCYLADYFNERESGPTWYTCGGNHDNWPYWNSMPSQDDGLTWLAKDCYYVHRSQGLVLDDRKHLFFGGAESIDKHHRIEGRSWWKEETPTSMEFREFFDAMEGYKPEVVVTHDAPLSIEIRKYNRISNPTPNGLEGVLKHSSYLPKLWMFGHHHIKEEWNIDGVKFYCCGIEGDYTSS